MATSNNPLAPNPETDLDGSDVYPPLEPEEDLGSPVPLGEEGNVEPDKNGPLEGDYATI
jgi:hypothetical protein